MSSREPAIRIHRIHDGPAPGGGMRVLVDRLWPRGITKERAGAQLWLKEVAPSTALRKWFGHDPARWDEFRRRYRAELDDNADAVERLLEIARRAPLTLLYSARDEDHNQAVVLAGYLRERLEKES